MYSRSAVRPTIGMTKGANDARKSCRDRGRGHTEAGGGVLGFPVAALCTEGHAPARDGNPPGRRVPRDPAPANSAGTFRGPL